MNIIRLFVEQYRFIKACKINGRSLNVWKILKWVPLVWLYTKHRRQLFEDIFEPNKPLTFRRQVLYKVPRYIPAGMWKHPLFDIIRKRVCSSHLFHPTEGNENSITEDCLACKTRRFRKITQGEQG